MPHTHAKFPSFLPYEESVAAVILLPEELVCREINSLL